MLLAVVLLLEGCHHKKQEMTTRPDSTVEVGGYVDSAETVPGTVNITTDTNENDGGTEVSTMPTPVHDRRARIKTAKVQPGQMLGEWTLGTLHEEYLEDGIGLAWDTEEVGKENAHHFRWSLENGWVMAQYTMELGGVVPSVTYVSEMDSVHMVRRDMYGNSYFFKKNNGAMID